MPRILHKNVARVKNVAGVEIAIYADSGEPGVPASQFMRAGGGRLKKVRLLTEDDLDQATKQGQRTWERARGNAKEFEKITALVELRNALDKDDPIAMSAALRTLDALAGIEHPIPLRFSDIIIADIDKLEEPERSEKLRALYTQEVAGYLKDTEAWAWWDGRRYVMAHFCPTVAKAFCLRALIPFATGRSLQVCPACHILFLTKRPDQEYCSIEHRETHRMARHRARKKRKEQRVVA